MLLQMIDGVHDGENQVITLGQGLGSCRVSMSVVKWGQLSRSYKLT